MKKKYWKSGAALMMAAILAVGCGNGDSSSVPNEEVDNQEQGVNVDSPNGVQNGENNVSDAGNSGAESGNNNAGSNGTDSNVETSGSSENEKTPEDTLNGNGEEKSEEETPTQVIDFGEDIPADPNAEFIVPKNGEIAYSRESGIYDEAFRLSLEAEGGEIWYTLDESDPRTSATAINYANTNGIPIRSGKDRKNVAAAVQPIEISGSYCERNKDRNGFVSTVSAPLQTDVDKCYVVKAAVRYEDGTVSPVQTWTYFVGTVGGHINGAPASSQASASSLAVISISADYDDLFGYENGIYVKGKIFDNALTEYLKNGKVKDAEVARSLDANYKQRGKEWERAAHIDFFETDAEGMNLVLSQDCGLRIQGNYSRSDLQKSFRLIASKDYGEKRFNYPVFGEELKNSDGETIDEFRKLVLRAGGNCAFTAKYNDTYWQSLLTESACDTKASRPCVVYLNGEYWGLYVLEEDYSEYYFEEHYGVDKDSIVIYKGDAEKYASGYKLDEGKLPEGVTEEGYFFNELFGFFKANSDLTNPEAYKAFSEIVDIDSVTDYFAVQIWINNKWDWPGKNWSMWKSTEINPEIDKADGKWRLSFYDMDFGGVSGEGEAGTNTIKDDNYKPLGLLDKNTNNPAVLCFAYLMTNEGYRETFYERLRGLAEKEFEFEAASAKLDEFEQAYGPLYEQFFNRFPGTGSKENALYGGYASSGCIRGFLKKRPGNIEKMITWAEQQYEK